jgi:hypothetical protein
MSETTNDATRDTVESYVTDMIALEQHILAALAGQIEDLDVHSEFKGPLIRLHGTCHSHIRALESLATRREQNLGGMSKAVKKAVSSVLGLGAAAIDFVRTEKLPKDLRDDYTATSLAYIGYLMLHTTALTLNDTEVAAIAATHLGDYAQSMMALQLIIPAATVAFLASEGFEVDSGALPAVKKTIARSWKS